METFDSDDPTDAARWLQADDRTVEVPEGCKVVFVTDHLIERIRAEADADGWSPARTIQVAIPPACEHGLVVEPCFRTVAG